MPDTPEKVVVESYLTSCFIEWTRPDMKGDFKAYQVLITFLGFVNQDKTLNCQEPIKKVDTVKVSENESFNFTNALPSANYSVQISAINDKLQGNFSKPVHCVTDKLFPSPHQPQLSSVRNNSVSLLALTRTPKKYCGFRKVSVVCSNGQNKFSNSSELSSKEDNVSITITGLTPFTEYSCDAVVENNIGKSSTSNVVFIKTLEGSKLNYFV